MWGPRQTTRRLADTDGTATLKQPATTRYTNTRLDRGRSTARPTHTGYLRAVLPGRGGVRPTKRFPSDRVEVVEAERM